MKLGTIFLEVGTSDTVNACRDWYVEHLSLEVMSEESGESVWLDGGGVSIGFHTGDPVGTPTSVNLSFDVDDVDAEAVRLRSEGVTLAAEPWDAPWGARVATCVDPAGHAVWLSTATG